MVQEIYIMRESAGTPGDGIPNDHSMERCGRLAWVKNNKNLVVIQKQNKKPTPP